MDMKVLLISQGYRGFIVKLPENIVKYKEKRYYNLRRDIAFNSIYSNVSPKHHSALAETTDPKEA